MTHEPPHWWSLSRAKWMRIQAMNFFSRRTDPKPRPDGYRNPKLSAVEALEASHTDEVPHEPSKCPGDVLEEQEDGTYVDPSMPGVIWKESPWPLRFQWSKNNWVRNP